MSELQIAAAEQEPDFFSSVIVQIDGRLPHGGDLGYFIKSYVSASLKPKHR